jgi:deazaflavin-dependent oxidoreductase (nitroreductase family)
MQQSVIEDVRKHGRATSGPFVGRDLLVLTTTGARSGAERSSALVFSRDGDDYVIVASKGGSPNHPGWYHNLVANPIVTVETGGERFKARATPYASGVERDRLYAAHAARYPVFLDYERKTDRTIPVVRLTRLAE